MNLQLFFLKVLDSGVSWRDQLTGALQALAEMLKDDATLSAYEVHSSNMVQVLLNCLSNQVRVTSLYFLVTNCMFFLLV